MVKPAPLRRLRQPITAFAILLIGLPALAQEAPKPPATEIGEPGFDEPMFLPLEFRPPDDTLHVGIRIGGKAKITFHGLGSMPTNWVPGLMGDTTTTNRLYADGQVQTDARTRPDGNPVNDGLTNTWVMNADAGHIVSDTTPGLPAGSQAIAFHSYSTESNGATATASSGATPSWDLEFDHRLGGKKVIWGIMFGAGLSDINAKASGTLETSLRVVTHVYSLYGAPAPGFPTNADGTLSTTFVGYTAPSTAATQQYDENGNLQRAADGSIVTVNIDNTTLLAQQPNLAASDDGVLSPTPVSFTGKWEVKGAFITIRSGPYVQASLTKRLTVRASAGAAFTLVGARMKYQETATLPVSSATALTIDSTTIASSSENTTTAKIGAFGSLDAEWMITRRTGFFLGLLYEGYSGTTDIVAAKAPSAASFDRVAKVETSAGLSFRLGLTARF
jgi:hypothetical protein